jgi:hypothetical protein
MRLLGCARSGNSMGRSCYPPNPVRLNTACMNYPQTKRLELVEEHFTTWRWGRIAGAMLAVGLVLKLAPS